MLCMFTIGSIQQELVFVNSIPSVSNKALFGQNPGGHTEHNRPRTPEACEDEVRLRVDFVWFGACCWVFAKSKKIKARSYPSALFDPLFE
jgi:hypothetical protein